MNLQVVRVCAALALHAPAASPAWSGDADSTALLTAQYSFVGCAGLLHRLLLGDQLRPVAVGSQRLGLREVVASVCPLP